MLNCVLFDVIKIAVVKVVQKLNSLLTNRQHNKGTSEYIREKFILDYEIFSCSTSKTLYF